MGVDRALKRLRIAIASAGRFHVLDLARELDALGHEVRFHSYVPRRRAERFGLPARAHVGLLGRVWPWVGLQHVFPRMARERVEAGLWRALDRALEATLAPCDVLIAMSGMYLDALEGARRRFGAKIVLVRGSKHILAQDEILARTPGAERPSRLSIERELAGYSLADMIAVPSRHVARSFEFDTVNFPKVVVNPYGVDLDQFPQAPPKTASSDLVFLFVGTWSLQKGCDLLEGAIRADKRFSLIHVGSLGDLTFPSDSPQFVRFHKVDQRELKKFYAMANALILPSRQDGFGLVLTQALASGLPVLCTDATGGDDVRWTDALSDRIITVPSESMQALQRGLSELASRLLHGPPFMELADIDRACLSWRGYAKRYVANISALLEKSEM